MDFADIVAGTTLVLVILVPTLAVSARIALRPIVESLLKLHQAFLSPDSALASGRVTQLERQVADLTEQVRQLEEAERFHLQLRQPVSPIESEGSAVSRPLEGRP